MINPAVLEHVNSLATTFGSAKPYRHVAIDDFFNAEVVRNILRDFPRYSNNSSINEFGETGEKAVHENLSSISEFYATLVDYCKTTEFAQLIGDISGIHGLRWGGETMYGGGTHENLNGAELDPHVDFNYHDQTKEHRRLNLLIYLNEEWDSQWGGEFELHSKPREPETNTVISYQPILNRAVLMETNEHSWHGFPKITLPNEKATLSRKSLALYFYTKERPDEEITGGHSTFYIQRPLPSNFTVGAQVSAAMHTHIHALINKRDGFIKLCHDKEIEKNREHEIALSSIEFLEAQIRVPSIGWATQMRQAMGYHPDGWLANTFSAEFKAAKPLTLITLHYWAADSVNLPKSATMSILDNTNEFTISENGAGSHSMEVSVAEETMFDVKIEFSDTDQIAQPNTIQDQRILSVVLTRIDFKDDIDVG